jgi:hypothetical protein
MTQSQHSQASRAVLTDLIIAAKIRKNLTFKAIAEGTGLSLAFVTAALLGQHPLPADAAKVVADIPLKVHVHGRGQITKSFALLHEVTVPRPREMIGQYWNSVFSEE